MTNDRRTISIASNDRGRVPFALISALLLLTSTAVVHSLATRPPSPEPDVDVSLAVDRSTSLARTTLRDAVGSGLERAAREPVTEPADTPVGRAINDSVDATQGYARDNQTFRAYVKLRIYLTALDHLRSTSQTVDNGTRSELSLPAVHYTEANLTEAIDRVELDVGSNTEGLEAGKIRATIEDVSIRISRDDRQVATRTTDLTVTVGSTVFQQHYDVIEYERRLSAGFFEQEGLRGFSRKFAAQVYPLAYAKTYYERALAPRAREAENFKSTVENYEVTTLANNAVFDVQRNVFGANDPRAGRTMTGAWACLAFKTAGKFTGRDVRDGLNSLCKATRFIYGGSTGDPPRSMSEILNRYVPSHTETSNEDQLETAGGALNRDETIHISNFSDPARAEVVGGSYDWSGQDANWEDQTEGSDVPTPDGEDGEVDVDTPDFPSEWDDSTLENVIEDVYSVEVSVEWGPTEQSGSMPSPAQPETETHDWQRANNTTTVIEQYVEVSHDGFDETVTDPRDLHRFNITVHRHLNRTVNWTREAEVPCEDSSEDCTETRSKKTYEVSSVTFSRNLTIQGNHTVGTAVARRGVEHAYRTNDGPLPPEWSTSRNFEPALAKSIEALLVVEAGEPAAGMERRIDPGRINDTADFESAAAGLVDSASGSERVDAFSGSASELKDWLATDLNRTNALVNGSRSGLDLDRTLEVSRMDLASDEEVFTDLKSQLREREDTIVYRGLSEGEAYANAPSRARVVLRKRYVEAIYDWIDRVEDERNEARSQANSEIEDDVSGEIDAGVSALDEGLSFAQGALDGAPALSWQNRTNVEPAPLTGDIEYQIHGSPTYLSAQPVSRDRVPSVRPSGEIIADPEDTLFVPMSARNDMLLQRPGIPLIPWPSYWYLSVNYLDVQVKGEYARFVATATDDTPGASGSISYIRQAQPVSVEINGLYRTVGSVEAIEFENHTPVVLVTPGGTVMPKGSLGPGDINVRGKPKHSLAECTGGWDHTGADFDPRTDVKAGNCDNINSGRSSAANLAFERIVPDREESYVRTVASLLDDDIENTEQFCHLSDEEDEDADDASIAALADGEGSENDKNEGCPDPELTVEFLYPGPKGAIILVQRHARDGESETMLIDTGAYDKSGRDDGGYNRNEIVQKLNKRGVERIDHLVVTHNHTDHIGGLVLHEKSDRNEGAGLLSAHKNREIVIEKIYYNGILNLHNDEDKGGIPASEYNGDEELAEKQEYFKENLVETSIPRDTLSVGDGEDLMGGNVEVEVLNPPDQLRNGEDCDDNKNDCNSIVLKISKDNRDFLLLSDIREGVEGDLMGAHEDVDVLQLAHHAGSDSNHVELLEELDPDYVVCTGGENDAETFPERIPDGTSDSVTYICEETKEFRFRVVEGENIVFEWTNHFAQTDDSD